MSTKPLKKNSDADEFISDSNVRRPKSQADDVVKLQKSFTQHLAAKMDENGHSIEDVAKIIGVSYSYIVAIKNGIRRIAKAEPATVEKFAEYLDQPVIQIYIWGGLFQPIDFVSRRTLEQALGSAYERMSNDPVMTTIVPSPQDWGNNKLWSEQSKVALVRMYEMVVGKLFLKHANIEMDSQTEKLFLNYTNKH